MTALQTHDEVGSFSSFQQNALEMKVHLHYKINIVCPNPASLLSEQDSSTPIEQMYENMWIVSKDEYDKCVVNKSISGDFSKRNLLKCQSPLQLTYYEMVFRAYSPPEGLEFTPGKKYYFIATSNGNINSISNYEGGRCVTYNMKLIIYVCRGHTDPYCDDFQTIIPSPSVGNQSPVLPINTCSCQSTS
ncbi:unnamed protein product, partial [Porites evermanni]